ncbi:hypothetical protein [Mesorhizobium sp. IMUNJ 23232]|uniref:hypothetical protein n=1 Tax=Mesorhizobium sp. IMUNJ 23232 TaxID=3376064 RepID=UPI0037AE71D3
MKYRHFSSPLRVAAAGPSGEPIASGGMPCVCFCPIAPESAFVSANSDLQKHLYANELMRRNIVDVTPIRGCVGPRELRRVAASPTVCPAAASPAGEFRKGIDLVGQ